MSSVDPDQPAVEVEDECSIDNDNSRLGLRIGSIFIILVSIMSEPEVLVSVMATY